MDQSLKALCDALKKVISQLKPQHHAISLTLITGRRNQGKSTLLRQAHFNQVPVEAGGAHIYFNQHGIIVELGESWINQSQYLLQYSLKQLNRCHRFVKISGILFCVDINELITATATDVPMIIKAHTQLLDKIGNDLGYPVDLAIFFTKLDLITGFCDFFQNEHELDLKKPWGFSLPELRLSSKPSEPIKKQFDCLLETMGQQIIHKIHLVRSSIKRTLIREFPLQLANSRQFILLLINELSPKFFRLQALYFTSAEQGGVSIDRLNTKIQQEYALTLQNQLHQSINHRAYFIDGALHAFQQLTKRAPPKTEISHRTAMVSLVACTILGLFIIGYQYFNSSQLLDKASQELIAFDSLGKSKHHQDAATYHLVKASKALDNMSAHTLLQPSVQALKKQLHQNTQQYLSNSFLPSMMRDIEQTLADSKLSHVDRYQTLKIYLMLGDPEHFSEQDVLTWFKQHWENQADSSAITKKLDLLTGILHPKTGLSQSMEGKQTNSHAKSQPPHAKVLKNPKTPHSNIATLPITLNKQAITDARNFLNALPTSYLYYSLAKTTFSKDTMNIPSKGFVLSSDKIPVYLTKSGFQDVMTNMPDMVKKLRAENWILARQDLNDLPILIQQAYCFEYVIWWQHFIQEARPTHIQDYDQATQLLKTIRQSNTINKLIEVVQTQTSPSKGPQSTVFNQEIASKFTELNLMSHSSLRHLILSLNELEKFLNTLAIVGDQGKTAFNITKARFQGEGLSNPLTAVYNQSQQLPAPLSTWTKQIADDAWFTLINNSRTYLNQAWQQQVFRDYQQNIANRYPFDGSKTDEITMHDFNQFFSPHGELNRFVEAYLKPFLDTSKAQWQLKEVNNYVLPISSDLIHELIRANVITNMFFPENSDTCQVEFTLQKVSLDPVVANLQLTMGDTKLKDTQGSDSFTEFHWPEANARLVVQSIEGQRYEIEELGSWAFFKILQKVNVLVDEQDSSNLQILFEINGNSGRYLLKAQNPVNPFIPGILNEFNLMDTIV